MCYLSFPLWTTKVCDRTVDGVLIVLVANTCGPFPQISRLRRVYGSEITHRSRCSVSSGRSTKVRWSVKMFPGCKCRVGWNHFSRFSVTNGRHVVILSSRTLLSPFYVRTMNRSFIKDVNQVLQLQNSSSLSFFFSAIKVEVKGNLVVCTSMTKMYVPDSSARDSGDNRCDYYGVRDHVWVRTFLRFSIQVTSTYLRKNMGLYNYPFWES